LFAQPGDITDGTVAMLCSLSLFFIPKTIMHAALIPRFIRRRFQNELTYEQAYNADGTVITILSWSLIQRLNWNIIFLIGGGFALSKGFEVPMYLLRLTRYLYLFIFKYLLSSGVWSFIDAWDHGGETRTSFHKHCGYTRVHRRHLQHQSDVKCSGSEHPSSDPSLRGSCQR